MASTSKNAMHFPSCLKVSRECPGNGGLEAAMHFPEEGGIELEPGREAECCLDAFREACLRSEYYQASSVRIAPGIFYQAFSRIRGCGGVTLVLL